MRYISYYRVTTDDPEKFNYDLGVQIKIIYDFLQPNDKLLKEFIEICPDSDCDGDRRILAEALQIAETKGATLVVSTLDRLCQSLHFISILIDSKKKFISCDLPRANTFIIHMHAIIIEHGMQKFIEGLKTVSGHADMRWIGLKISENFSSIEANRPKHVHLTKNQTDEFAMAIMPIIKNIERPDVYSRMGIANALNTSGIKTSCGNQWTPKLVKNLLLHYYSIVPPQSSVPIHKGITISHFLPSILPNFFSTSPLDIPPPPLGSITSANIPSPILPDSNLPPPILPDSNLQQQISE